jgi:hypothetical protein
MRRDRTDTPLRWQPTPDGRSRGTFTQFVRDHVAAHPEGVARKDVIARGQRTGKVFQLPRSPGGMDAAIARLVHLGELVEADGLLRSSRPGNAAKRSRGR